MKVVSLNLWHGGVLFDDIIRFLSEQNADIVLLQEAYNGTDPTLDRQYRSIQELQKVLAYQYDDFAADYRDFDRTEGKAQRGNAVLSRFPILDRSTIFFNNPYSETYRDVPGNYHNCPRDLQYVALDTPQGTLHVFNIQGSWDLDGDNDSPQRKEMCDAIIQSMANKSHVVLGGDTNAKPANKAIQRIEEHLTSVYGTELKTTFNMRRKDNPGYASAAVDMFFVSNDIRVLSHDCPDVDISDHLPLVMSIDLV
jgi:endonuclease/exonuclease/phosphatase family metal-dependent hydrolase